MFQLSKEEFEDLRLQFETLEKDDKPAIGKSPKFQFANVIIINVGGSYLHSIKD
ncbi:MAG: hypothetical protein ABI374_10840 [Ginsengibacter sp.]